MNRRRGFPRAASTRQPSRLHGTCSSAAAVAIAAALAVAGSIVIPVAVSDAAEAKLETAPRASTGMPTESRAEKERDSDARLAELRATVERDQEAIRRMLSLDAEGRAVGEDAPLPAPEKLREIAERLPAAQAELRDLEEARAARSKAAPGGP